MNKEQCYATCKHIAEIAKQHASSVKQHFDCIQSEVVAERYGMGGEMLHRGWYCPSIVFDIIYGNVNRGKAVDFCPSKSKPHYVYGFDRNGQLVTVETPTNYEAIFRCNHYTVGYTFNKAFCEIESISECNYYDNGKIKDYSVYLYNPESNQVTSLKKEVYTYKNDQLVVDVYEFADKNSVLIHDRYLFCVVDGFLSSYTVEEYDGSNRKESLWDGHTFRVRIRRKT